MGIKYFVFAVNKMDLVGYDEARFNEIKAQIDELAEELKLESVYIIPVSATEGDNVTTKSENITWYKGEAILPYLEKIDVTEKKKEEGFYMPVQRVCRPDHTFRGFQGQIESGSIAVGDDITTLPSNEHAKVKSILVGDKQSESAFMGQPVTIQLDREVDVSRGCVLSKDTNLPLSKSFTSTILWMDDNELTPGTDYFVKLGTKQIPAVLKDIQYKIDVNTGEHINAETIGKNGIAVCEILLTEAVVADLFEEHRTLGELILIDRVTNMTSACGVVDELKEKGGSFSDRASFKFENLEARGDIFEEFYYDPQSLSVLKYQPVDKTYTVGDKIPTEGESYKYPDSFDIIVLRDGVTVKVRNKKIGDIIETKNYEYDGYPVINGRGFEIKADSREKVVNFLREYATRDDENKFFEKWLNFNTYRKVTVK